MSALHLNTPWAQAAITPDDRRRVEAAIPAGEALDVAVTADRRRWIIRGDGWEMRVSTRVALHRACLFALDRHRGAA